MFGAIGLVEHGEHEGQCCVCASAAAAEEEAQDFADRLLDKLDPAMLDFHEAGYQTARAAAEAIVGDGGPAAVRLRAVELVAEALEALS